MALGALAATVINSAVMAEDATIGIQSEPSSMDPHFHNTGPNNSMLGQIFGRLADWSPTRPRLFRGWQLPGKPSTTPLGNSSCARA
jgi:peptide/nickel transport system substrate-binding protein